MERQLWANAPRPPRRWQEAALPEALSAIDRGKKGIIWACTGGGKSVLLSELSRLISAECSNEEVVVISTPTQSLVRQLAETVGQYVGFRNVGQYYAAKKEIRKVIVSCNPSLPSLHEALAARGLKVKLLICDEVHGSESDTLKTIIPVLNPGSSIGFTATPYRGDSSQSLSLWDELLYRYTFADALKDGVLVPFLTKNWDGTGDSDVDRICAELIAEHTTGPGIVSALRISDAEDYAKYLSERDIPAMAIYGAMTEKEKQYRLKALQMGEIRALVHCQLLAEGVDLPWLRWLCLRRPVGSAVRFVQELGRGLRVDSQNPEKRNCIVIDPHDLVGYFGLGQTAKLGESLDEAMEAEERKKKEEEEKEETPIQMPPAVAIDKATGWTRMLLLSLQANGLAGDFQAPGSWRTRRPSEKQIRAILGDSGDGKKGLARMAKYLPEPSRTTIKLMCREGVLDELQSGAVSDLLSILKAIADATANDRRSFAMGMKVFNPWKFPSDIEIPELDPSVVAGLGAV